MSWIAAGLAGSAAVGAGAGYLSAKSSNKKRPGVPEFIPYSGIRPPRVNYNPATESNVPSPGNILRPVQQMITDTLMRRSQGKDVGYDPARRDELQKNFDIQQNRDWENQSADIKNRLAGQGLSRNVAANDELLGRALRNKNEEKNLYTNRIDIEDLGQRNKDTTHATDQLQTLNTQNFGQENKAADFDLSVYNDENAARQTNYADQNIRFGQYEDPMGSALAGAQKGTQLASSIGGGGTSFAPPASPTPTYDPSTINSVGFYNAGINQDPRVAALRGYGTGKNLTF